MCILIYYICSRCFCGYPRFTECCSSMHPPLIHCPRSTQFRFRVVEETECYLHPHHAPLLHLGASGEDTVLSVSPSGSGPIIETVTRIPFKGGDSASGVLEPCKTLQLAPIRRSTSLQSFDTKDRHKTQNDSNRTVPTESTQPTDGDVRLTANGSQSNNNFTSQGHNRSQPWTVNSNNWHRTTNGSAPRGRFHPSSSYGYYTNTGGSRAPFDFQYRARRHPQYQYYPHQAAPIPPFHASSGTAPPGCTYLPVHGWGQYYQYQDRVTSPFYNSSCNQMCPEPMPGNDTSLLQTNQFNQDTNRDPPYSAQAVGFEPHTNEENKSLFEMRRENLEQLQRSNDAAYYNCLHHGNSQSLFSYDDEDIASQDSPLFIRSPRLEMLSAEDAYRTTRRGRSPYPRSRSLSESYIRRASVSGIPSPTIQGSHGPSQYDHRHNIANEANGGIAQDMETHSAAGFLWCEEAEDKILAPRNIVKSSSCSSLEALNRALEANSIDSDVSIKQESDDEAYKLGNLTEWMSASIKTDFESEAISAKGQETPNRVRSEGSESDVNTEDWCNAFELPLVPPNSPVLSLSSLNGTHTPRSTVENDSQPATKDDAMNGLDVQSQVQPSFPTGDAFTSDVCEKTPLLAQKSAVNKSWSAVVSGSYVPSESSDPFPTRITAPARAIHTITPTNALGMMLEQAGDVSNLPTTAPKTFQELSNNASIVTPSVQPILPQTSGPPTLPPNPQTSLDSVSAALERSLELLNSVWEHRFSSGSSLGSDDFAVVTEETIHSEPDETTPAPVAEPAQDANPTTPDTSVQPAESVQTSPTVPTEPASTPVATDVQTSPTPRYWSQLFQGSGPQKKLPSLTTKSDSSIDDTNWPPLGSGDPNNTRKRNTSS
ncbi:hypothetical protein F5Y12DRAFT_668409 [Xylaria sp. FL1777]|nr:hypothetical protein F5Y12DRAFT_668409 [Xylaria sp. FL1777]